MVQGVILSLLLGYLPMLVFACVVFWFDRFEKEPLGFLVAGFTWGSLITAAFAFVLNSLIGAAIFWVSQSQAITNFSVASVAAPVIEEVFKGGFVLAIFLLARHEFDSLLDGIVYGAIVGLGFAATENFYYILNMGFFQDGLDGLVKIAVIRIILVGWQHPFYTAFTGVGFACARNSKKQVIKFAAPMIGVAIAIAAHAVHNTISPFLILRSGDIGMLQAASIDWLGWALVAILIALLNQQEKARIKHYLAEEVQTGILSDWLYLHSYNKQSQKKLLRETSLRHTSERKLLRRLFQVCAELAHKKWQQDRHGNEITNAERIASLRNSLAILSRQTGSLIHGNTMTHK